MSRGSFRGSGKVGEARIEITGDNSQLDATLDESKAKVDQFATSASDGFEKVGSKIDDSTAGVRRFSGAISGAVGAATALLGVFTAIAGITALIGTGVAELVSKLRTGKENADGFLDQLKVETRDVDAQINAIVEAIEDLDSRIEKLRKNADVPLATLGETGLGRSPNEAIRELENERAILDAALDERRQQNEARNRRASRAAAEAAFTAIEAETQARLRAAEDIGRSEAEIIQRDTQARLDALAVVDRKRRELGANVTDEQIQKQLEAIVKEGDIRLSQLEQRTREEDRAREERARKEAEDVRKRAQAEIDAIDKVAERFEKSILDAFEKIRDEQIGLFGGTGSGADAVVAAIRDLQASQPEVPMRAAGEVFRLQ